MVLVAVLHKLGVLSLALLLVGDVYWCNLASGCEVACAQCERSCAQCTQCPNGCRCDVQSTDSCFCKGASVSSSDGWRGVSGRSAALIALPVTTSWPLLHRSVVLCVDGPNCTALNPSGREVRLLVQSLLN